MSSISKASNVSGAATTPSLDASRRSPMAAISARRGSCFPARQNLSSICRPGSIPIPTRSRSFRADVHAAAAARRARRARCHRRGEATARRRASAVVAGAGLADPAGADGLPVGARPRRGLGADLCRAWPRGGACGPQRRRSCRGRRSWPTRASPSSSTRTIPMGGLVAKDALLALADRLRRRGGLLLVDEAFMDVGPEGASLADHVEEGNIVVLRSFGKFYGLPGLGLSFALAAPEIATRIGGGAGALAGFGRGHRRSARRHSRMPSGGSGAQGLAEAALQARCVLSGRGSGRLAAPRCSAWCGARTRAACFSRWARPASWCGVSPSIRRGCASVFPAAKPEWQRLERALASVRGDGA